MFFFFIYLITIGVNTKRLHSGFILSFKFELKLKLAHSIDFIRLNIKTKLASEPVCTDLLYVMQYSLNIEHRNRMKKKLSITQQQDESIIIVY